MEALRYEAVYMILIHNHPSGCPEHSREDLH
ncbi:MAG: JAB domain-containing protein [Anaerobutyricum soehngenii]